MAKRLFVALLSITLCIVFESVEADTRTQRNFGRYKAPTTDYDDEQSDPSTKSSPSSKLLNSNYSPESIDDDRDNIPSNGMNFGKPQNSGFFGNKAAGGPMNSMRPMRSLFDKRPSFQPNSLSSPFGGASPLAGPFSSPSDLHNFIANRLGAGGLGNSNVIIVKRCCLNETNCRVLKNGEICSPELFSSPPSSSSPSSTSASDEPFDPYGTPDSSTDRKRDPSNFSPGSVNSGDLSKGRNAPENDAAQQSENPLATRPGSQKNSMSPMFDGPYGGSFGSPLGNLISKRFGNGGVIDDSGVLTIRKCCMNGKCVDLIKAEVCDVETFLEKVKNKQQQSENDVAPESPDVMSEADVLSNIKKLMADRLKPFGAMGGFGSPNGNGSQKAGKPNGANDMPTMNSKNTPQSGGDDADDGSDPFGDMMKTFMGPSSSMMGPDYEFGGDDADRFSGATQQNKPIPKYPHESPDGLTEEQVKNIRDKVLEVTNAYRGRHKLEPLVMDENLNNYAQNWANNLTNKGLQHRTDHNYGENLYSTTDPRNVGEKSVSAWYNEMSLCKLNPDEGQWLSNSGTHHMTQLLWKNSKTLGVGVSKRAQDGKYTVVANYDPPGNFVGQFVKNMPVITQSHIDNAKAEQEKANQNRVVQWQRMGPYSTNSRNAMPSKYNSNFGY